MNIAISSKQLGNLKDFILPSLPPRPDGQVQPSSDMGFGSVRLGKLERLWEGKTHPMVIVEEYEDPVPPFMQLRPSTSLRRKGPGVLELPKGVIRFKKMMAEGVYEYVTSYVLCYLKLLEPLVNIKAMQFINNLAPQYHEPLRACLKEVR